jgi:hypothetical protein
MAITTKDTPDNEAVTRRRAPRPRTSPAEPKGYARARTEFEGRAQDWLLSRPGKAMDVPGDLHLVARRGVPCRNCGALIYRDGDAGHTIEWNRTSGRHWASGITASCR